jgi:Resolvase, N terminal domain
LTVLLVQHGDSGSSEHAGTTWSRRKEFATIPDFIRAGDVLVVTRIDRLTRSISDLQDVMWRNGAETLAPAYKAQAIARAKEIGSVLRELEAARLSARGMAAEMNQRGVVTPVGGRWHAQTVIRAMQRLE